MSTEGKVDPMIGKRFGSLVVVSRMEDRAKSGHYQYVCNCDCGTKNQTIIGSKLRSGAVTTCVKCRVVRVMPPTKVGDVYGRLTVVELLEEKNSDGRQMCMCKCSCGNDYKLAIKSLRVGNGRSCGCLRRHSISARNYRHGYSVRGDCHPLHGVYHDMKRRCCDPRRKAYPRYGGRGISVCEEWKSSMDTFIVWAESNGYKEGLTIDRIDNDGDYEPSNCRWVNRCVQSANKGVSTMNTVGYKGLQLYPNCSAWAVRLSHQCRHVQLGPFTKFEEAVDARNSYITKHELDKVGHNIEVRTPKQDLIAKAYKQTKSLELLSKFEDTEYCGIKNLIGPRDTYVSYVNVGEYVNVVCRTQHLWKAIKLRDRYILKHQLQQKYDPQLNKLNQL